MDSTNPAKKRKTTTQHFPPHDSGTVLSANLSLADLNKLVDQRVADAVKTETILLTSRVDGLIRKCESLERSVKVLQKSGCNAVERAHNDAKHVPCPVG